MRPQLSREIQWVLEEKYHGRLTPPAKKDIARLQKGEHIDYVIGFVDFLGCKVDLSLRPLIPCPETEYWVEKAIAEIKRSHYTFSSRFIPAWAILHGSAGASPKLPVEAKQLASTPTRLQKSRSFRIRCLDLFAGSGCIGVAVLKHVPQVCMDFGEKEKLLLSQIRLNAKKNGIEKKRYRVIQSDIFSGIRGRYDYIFANPPYIAELRKNRVQASVLKHEPREALFAGKDGLFVIKKFLGEAHEHLSRNGKIYLEFDSPQKGEIEKLLTWHGYGHWEFHKDQFGKWRFLCVVRKNMKKHPTSDRNSTIVEKPSEL